MKGKVKGLYITSGERSWRRKGGESLGDCMHNAVGRVELNSSVFYII